MSDITDHDYVAALSCASLLLATHLQSAAGASPTAAIKEHATEAVSSFVDKIPFLSEKEDEASQPEEAPRETKMGRVVELKRKALASALNEPNPDHESLKRLTTGLSSENQIRLLVDLMWSDPFAPYSLKFDQDDLVEGLRGLAPAIGSTSDVVDEIEETRRSAMKAYKTTTARKIGVAGVVTALAIGSAGWLAAPLLGGMLGGAAGLSGAAATAHGLALLGGGSIAAGGSGMAGGMWVVATAGAAMGGIGGSASTMFYQLGAAQTRVELVKLQVTFRVAVLGAQADLIKAQSILTGLMEREQEVRQTLDEERQLNDKNARRVKDLAEKLDDIVSAREWMEHERSERETADVG